MCCCCLSYSCRKYPDTPDNSISRHGISERTHYPGLSLAWSHNFRSLPCIVSASFGNATFNHEGKPETPRPRSPEDRLQRTCPQHGTICMLSCTCWSLEHDPVQPGPVQPGHSRCIIQLEAFCLSDFWFCLPLHHTYTFIIDTRLQATLFVMGEVISIVSRGRLHLGFYTVTVRLRQGLEINLLVARSVCFATDQIRTR